MVPITVFTPAYNRAVLLERCYESLKRQTDKRFIWMIIDDGSTDNTREVVAEWISQTTAFDIQYYYKENGGNIKVISRSMQKHHPHGLDDPTPIIEFVENNF